MKHLYPCEMDIKYLPCIVRGGKSGIGLLGCIALLLMISMKSVHYNQ